jgi:hypothetical protein
VIHKLSKHCTIQCENGPVLLNMAHNGIKICIFAYICIEIVPEFF